jgi:tetratricopeptide (TPR) repeat protein
VKSLILAVLLLIPPHTAGQKSEPPQWRADRLHSAEFPAADVQIASLELGGLRVKDAARRFAREPDEPETVRALVAQRRFDDALTVLRTIVSTRPERMTAAFAAVGSSTREMVSDGARSYGSTMRAIVADARRGAATLPREQAAELARILLTIQAELDRARDWSARRAAFVAEYAGTETALLTEVDVLTERIGPPMLEALDAFVQTNVGTTAAAKALYQKAFHLGHNAMSFGERPGQDPTDRFFRVREISKELRTGRYPPSEWVDRAQTLVTQFFAYKATYAPGNVERILAALEEELPSLLEAYEQDVTQDMLGFVIGTRMGDLFKLKGDPVPAIEGVFDRLEKTARRPDVVRLLRAEFYLRPSDRAESKADRAALRTRAEAALESVASNGAGVHQRRALATLARMRFGEGAFEAARDQYRRYLSAYPDTSYTWVAALRLAQCEESLGNPAEAATLFRQASERFRVNPVAHALGRAYAGRASEAAGNFPQALEYYQSALSVWDLDYGPRLSLYDTRSAQSGNPFISMDEAVVIRDSLVARTAELRRSTSTAGGASVERGRWLIGRGRWSEAATALSEFLAKRKGSPLASEARALLHRARLEQALDLVDADRPTVDVAAAMSALKALSAEPVDFGVCAARIALATVTLLSRSEGDPDAMMADAMKAWQSLDKPPAAGSRTPVERDVIHIRNEVFKPKGGGVLDDGRWNAFKWEAANAPYVVVDSELRVKSSTGAVTTVAVYDAFPDVPNVLFLNDERRAVLERVMLRLGGTKKFAWTEVMQTPNQPAGPALDVLSLWKKSFWAQPGHWGGWVFESYPIITEIEFVDEARTRAAVKVTVGYSGGTVQMHKENGVWVARELTNWWIT